MISKPKVIGTIPALRRRLARDRATGDSIALVPTMGALHEGHLSLVRLARRKARRVVVSIFVNPTQFAPTEDLASYPRTFKADLAALTEAQVDVVWAPVSASVMYPPDFATRVTQDGPATVGLEDAFRPHFFGGVATVVCKLFTQVAPDIAVFGEKDYQQLCVVKQMVRDLDLPLEIVGLPTVREPDGLAMSSRNAYLSPQERAVAPTLYRIITKVAETAAEGGVIAGAVAEGNATLAAAGFKVDYLEVRDAETLKSIPPGAQRPLRVLVAAWLGKTRLIDNVGIEHPLAPQL